MGPQVSDEFLEQKGSGTWHFPGDMACVGLGRPGSRPYLAETGLKIFLAEFNLLFTTFSSSKHSLPSREVNGFLSPHELLLYDYTLQCILVLPFIFIDFFEVLGCQWFLLSHWSLNYVPMICQTASYLTQLCCPLLFAHTHTKSKQPKTATTSNNETPHHPIMYLILLETFSLFLK